MPASSAFGGPALAKCALGRKALLKDGDSMCAMHVTLSGPFSSWKMDHPDIEAAAKSAAKSEGKDGALQRCDFAVYQAENPNDGNSHLVLVECKKTFREKGTEGEKGSVEEAIGQLADSLRVLRRMAGEKNFGFDRLHLLLVYRHPEEYRGAIPSGGGNAVAHQTPIGYNGRNARLKVQRNGRNGVEIDDGFKFHRRPDGKRRK